MAKEKDNSQIILDDVLTQLHAERAPETAEGEFFEIFCAEQILKDYDLSYEEIQSGIVDGEHDGGVDAVYAFANGELITEDFDVSPFKKDVQIDLHILQSKTSPNFSEASIDKLVSISRHLLDLSKDIDSLDQFNDRVRGKFRDFRNAYRSLAARFPTLKISYTLSGKRPNLPIPTNFTTKSKELIELASQHFSNAEVTVSLLGSKELTDLARRQPKKTFELRCVKSLTSEGGFIVLSKLSDFDSFLKDENGHIRKGLFESNVRDFQGTTEVNDAIRNTLGSTNTPDFWWLNNGVTILSSRAAINGDIVSIQEPQIVNGLQTSTQISQHFSTGGVKGDSRSVMIKVVSSEDDESRDKIIKATNSQNPIQPATLRATDKVQRDIEVTLKAYGLFYDRRKNFYKNDGKPAEKIISIPLMAQVLMSVMLARPDDARARPSSLIKDDKVYQELFSETIPVQVYSFCAVLIRAVDKYLKAQASLSARDKSNMRFYVASVVVWSLTNTAKPEAAVIAALGVEKITEPLITEAFAAVSAKYTALGATDQVAKGPDLSKQLQEAVKALSS
jgi:hypothetical protein